MTVSRFMTTACCIAVFGGAAFGETIRGSYVGCTTENALDEFTMAAVNRDRRQMEALIGVSCLPINGLEYSVVDRGFITSEIRVYVGSDSIRVFTPSEALR